MTINLKAVFTHGVLKPLEPLRLSENQTVSLQVTALETVKVPPSDFSSLYGIWKDHAADLDAALTNARQATEEKLERIIREAD